MVQRKRKEFQYFKGKGRESNVSKNKIGILMFTRIR